jgi:hypothetical protein
VASGLLRFARNDGTFAVSFRERPVFLIGQRLQMPGIDGKVAIVPYYRGAVIPDRRLGKDRRLAQRR